MRYFIRNGIDVPNKYHRITNAKSTAKFPFSNSSEILCVCPCQCVTDFRWFTPRYVILTCIDLYSYWAGYLCIWWTRTARRYRRTRTEGWNWTQGGNGKSLSACWIFGRRSLQCRGLKNTHCAYSIRIAILNKGPKIVCGATRSHTKFTKHGGRVITRVRNSIFS